MSFAAEPQAAAKSKTASVWWLLLVAVLIAAGVRLLWALNHGLVLEQEGVEYTRIAENLLRGRGYVGIFNNGTQLNFPPLYPLLIAAVTQLTGSPNWAARAINIVLGALLVVPMFLIAQRMYGRRAAVTVAVLVMFHPVLLAAGASSYSEGPYLTLMMFAVLCLMNWIRDRRSRWSAGAGALFGLAYLIRPEAFLFAGLAAACGVLAAWHFRLGRSVVLGSAALLGCFAVIAAPNVAFLTHETGKLRIEAKGTLAFQWGSRMNQGMSYAKSANGIGADLSDQGVFMQPNLAVISSAKMTPGAYAHFVLEAARKNVKPIFDTLTGEAELGSPWLFMLVALGLCATVWTRYRATHELVVLATAALFVLVLLTVQALWFRYFICTLGVMLLWAGKGADELQSWGAGSAQALGAGPRLASFAGAGLKWLLVAVVLLLSLRSVRYETQFSESQNLSRRAAGEWLAQQQPKPSWIMDTSVQVAFYAGADLMYLPYADSDLAVRYVAKKHPDYIVLLERGASGLPYQNAWYRDGIPDARATLVYDRGSDSGERVKIYRWSGAGD